MEKERSGRWSAGKVLAVVIPICLVVAAVAVTLVLVLGKTKTAENGSSSAPSQEGIVKTYDELNKQAEAAVAELEKLASQEALAAASSTSPEPTATSLTAYQQELAALNQTFAQLAADVSEAAAAVEQAAASVETASSAVTTTAQEYQQLYAQISAYYAYLEQLTNQAVSQLQYLQSTVPALQDIQQVQTLVQGMSNTPPLPARRAELQSQLSARAQGVLSRLQTNQPPQTMGQYGTTLQSLAGQVNGIAQQAGQALASGNKASIDALAEQMNAAVDQAERQLSADLGSAFSGYSSQLSAQAGQVDAARSGKQ